MYYRNFYLMEIFIFILHTRISDSTSINILGIRKYKINKTPRSLYNNLSCTTILMNLDIFKNDYSLFIKSI